MKMVWCRDVNMVGEFDPWTICPPPIWPNHKLGGGKWGEVWPIQSEYRYVSQTGSNSGASCQAVIGLGCLAFQIQLDKRVQWRFGRG